MLFAALAVVMLGFAALGVDIAQQVTSKQLLVNQLDAAATAGAARLGDGSGIGGAVTASTTFFAQNGQGALDPSDVDFWCVVARKQNPDGTPTTPATVADLQIPTTTRSGGVCNPDAVGASTTWRQQDYQDRPRTWDGRTFDMTCSATICAVPCGLQASPSNGWAPGTSAANNRPITCNTIRTGAERDVAFSFAPVLGVDEGSTGSQISVACAGSCGSVAFNPMDVAIVADRTLSMTEPLACTLTGGSCRDYRDDLTAGIRGLLQVMTPELQYVAFGAIGPSALTRTTAETKACTSSAQGLVFPGANPSPAAGGSWIPIEFKKDYLGAADANGKRALNPSSKLVQAITCFDTVNSTGENRLVDTRTSLASPLKAAARYVLGKSGDENNVGTLGGANRPGDIKKVIIFETDGEPYEAAATTTGTVTLDNRNEIFSNHQDFTSSAPVMSAPALGSVQNNDPRSVNPAPPSPFNQAGTYPASYTSGGNTYSYTYKHRISTTTSSTTRTFIGGQKACQNFAQVAAQAKQAGILLITIGYNLGSSMCSGSNSAPDPATTTGAPWISDIQPTTCRNGGSGTQASPYTKRTACAQNMTITYTVPQTKPVVTVVQGPGDARVNDVLAAASGGGDAPAATSSGCSTPETVAAENSDEDLFFCAARGDELAPLFVTALSRVSTGSKLIRLP